MNDTETIKDLYCRYWQYMIAKNEEGLKDMMADTYYLLHMTGVRQSHDVFLKGLKDHTFNYYSAVHDEIDVQVNKDEAHMIGKSRVLAAVYGGAKTNWALRNEFSLKKENGEWKFTSCKVTTY